MRRPHALLAALLPLLLVGGLALRRDARAEPASPQPVPKAYVAFDDGDSVTIRWPDGLEVVRLLGIDAPEVQHLEHDLPFAQPFGREAAGFLRGCVAVCDEIAIVRAQDKDPYGRTLAYLLLDGKSYSALVVAAGLAVCNVDHFGDNGLPQLAAEVERAAKDAGPVPFEKPHRYRARMREVSAWMKKQGTYPTGPADEEAR